MSKVNEVSQGTGDGLAIWTSRRGSAGDWASVRDITTNSKTSWQSDATGTNALGTNEAGIAFETTPTRTMDRMLVLFKTDTILDPPETASVVFDVTNLTNANPGTGNNVTKWALVKPTKEFIIANLEKSVALFQASAANPGGDTVNDIDGWTAGFAWDSVLYSDVILHTDLSAGAVTINLNKQARKDMASQDSFGFWVQNYTHDQRNQDPATVSASPGSAVDANFRIAGANTILKHMPGARREQTPTKERIDDKFTINSFSDITDQRKSYTRNEKRLDQVPFQLGIKGPLSLRGRQNDTDGTPLTTAGPPKVTN
tara:strand:- start:555 stop:1496 length:942 start_codon:yes stop_codon:yes gene_type:complete